MVHKPRAHKWSFPHRTGCGCKHNVRKPHLCKQVRWGLVEVVPGIEHIYDLRQAMHRILHPLAVCYCWPPQWNHQVYPLQNIYEMLFRQVNKLFSLWSFGYFKWIIYLYKVQIHSKRSSKLKVIHESQSFAPHCIVFITNRKVRNLDYWVIHKTF